LFGTETRFSDPATHQEGSLLDLLLDYEKSCAYFKGSPTLIDTREGIRCRVALPRDAHWQRERQAHTDQLLGVLAELGVPLNHAVTTAGGQRTVQRLLDDALANFDPKQQEIEWSAMAFSLYLPPGRTWKDKYGITYTFDDLAAELLNRPLGKAASCAGLHLLYSLAILLRADQEHSVLTPAVRGRVRAYLDQMAGIATKTQSAEGSWQSDWHTLERNTTARTRKPTGAEALEVLVTGHQVEWLLLLPPDILPPRQCFLQAARWLQVRLQADSEDLLRENYCPYSHVGRVLLLMTTRTPQLKGVAIGPAGGFRLDFQALNSATFVPF
jgi:hypothetical protein